MIRAVLFDLDGVIRHFPSTPALEIERRVGLSRGSLDAAAFAEPLITEVTTGRISRAEWVSLVGAAVGSPAAAVEWGTQRGEVDAGALDLLTELRAAGLDTAILTNGTDTPRNSTNSALPDASTRSSTRRVSVTASPTRARSATCSTPSTWTGPRSSSPTTRGTTCVVRPPWS